MRDSISPLEQQYDKALDHFEGKFAKTNNPFAGLCEALLADRLKDAEKRDAALQQIKAKGPATCVKRRANLARN